MLRTILSALHISNPNLITAIALWNRYYYLFFTIEKTEVPRYAILRGLTSKLRDVSEKISGKGNLSIDQNLEYYIFCFVWIAKYPQEVTQVLNSRTQFESREGHPESEHLPFTAI